MGAHKSGLIGEDAGSSPKNIFPCLTKTAFGRMPEVRVFGDDYNTPDGTGKLSMVAAVFFIAATMRVGSVESIRPLSAFVRLPLRLNSDTSKAVPLCV